MTTRFTTRWTRTAEADVADILEYIARQDGADRALRWYEGLQAGVATLASFPKRARVVPELRAVGLKDFRELLHGPYRVFFRIDGRRVVLLGLIDGRRDLGELLIERALRREDGLP